MGRATEHRVTSRGLVRRFSGIRGGRVARLMSAGTRAWSGMATCRRHRAARHDAEKAGHPAHIALLNRRAAGCR